MTWCTILFRYIWIFACEVGRSDSTKISPTSLVQAHCPRTYLAGRLRIVAYFTVLLFSFCPVLLGSSYCVQPGGCGGPHDVHLWADWNEPWGKFELLHHLCSSQGHGQWVFSVTLLSMETHHIHSSNKSLSVSEAILWFGLGALDFEFQLGKARYLLAYC